MSKNACAQQSSVFSLKMKIKELAFYTFAALTRCNKNLIHRIEIIKNTGQVALRGKFSQREGTNSKRIPLGARYMFPM
jgi:hypothetical protein